MLGNSKKILASVGGVGMWQDSDVQFQPSGRYREVWNGVVERNGLDGGYVVRNEGSTVLEVAIEGEVRGMVFAEERDQYIVFVKGKDDVPELGIVDNKSKEYKVLVRGGDLDLDCDMWHDMELKVLEPCGQLHLYWSSRDSYKVVNLDDPCCEFKVKPLIRCDCAPAVEASVYDNGGALPSGAYYFFVRLRDAEGNDTNWFHISKPVYISDGDHEPGAVTRKGVLIKLRGLNPDYSFVDVGVVSTVAGVTTVRHVDTVSYGESTLDYFYRGDTGKEAALSFEQVRTRGSRYIRGRNLVQYDGRLILYNLVSEHNLDYQRQANEIVTEYVQYVVPAAYADRYTGLRPNENYWFALRWNYCDGTSSVAFDIPGREAESSDLEEVDSPCGTCKLPRWRVQDTSKRLNTYTNTDISDNGSYEDEIYIGDYSGDLNTDDVPLTEDERDSIDELSDSDMPDYQEWRNKLKDYKITIDGQLDCLCEEWLPRLRDCDVEFPCIPVNELYGRISLAMLECICRERSMGGNSGGGSGGGGGGGTPVQFPENIQNILNVLSDPDAMAALSCTGGGCSSSSGGGCVDGGCGGSGYSCGSCGGTCNGGDCRSGVCTNCGSSCGIGCSSENCTKLITDNPNTEVDAVGNGRDISVYVDYAINTIGAYMQQLHDDAAKYNTPCDTFQCTDSGCIVTGDGCVVVESGHPCCQEGLGFTTSSGFTFSCKSGQWHVVMNKSTVESRSSYQRENKKGEGAGRPVFDFEKIYDEDGCEVIGVKPMKYSDGRFGYWETEEVYPFTVDCNCEYIYGDLAGKPVRLHRVPSVAAEPHFVSFKGGVPNQYDMGNMEDKDSYVLLTGLRVRNITMPKNLPKPLCPNNPFSILYVQRTEANKSVVGSGLAISCFKGEIQGEPYVFPKHGVNSWERYDRSIEPLGRSTFRGGLGVKDAPPWDRNPKDVSPYVIHSFDFHVNRPPLDATTALFELELYGKGFRHGLYAEDEQPDSPWTARVNQKGARQSLLLNHFRGVKGAPGGGYVARCVNGMSYAAADSIVSNGGVFSYPLCNLWRESSVYVEIDGSYVEFVEGDKQGMGDKYGGIRRYRNPNTGAFVTVTGDNSSDRSFTGDVLCHQMPIHDVRSHLVTFTRYLPRQYGSPVGQVYIPLGLEGSGVDLLRGCVEGLVGDSFVGSVSFRRTSYVSDKTNRKIAPRVNAAVLTISNATIRRMFGRVLDFIFRSLGVRDGGYIPRSCDEVDFVNRFGGLRDQGLSIRDDGRVNGAPNGPTSGPDGGPQYKGEFNDGELPIPARPTFLSDVSDRNLGDNYWPHLLKSNVWLWLNSDANPAYRRLGAKDAMEVYWPKLKGMRLDSSVPDHWNWRDAYLNRFYILWESNPKWKYIFASVFLFFFVWVIGIWIVIQGFNMMNNGFQAFGGGTYSLQTIGGVLAVLVALVVMSAGVWWMFYWAKNDFDNKFVENLIGLKNTRVDIRNPREPATADSGSGPPTYSTFDGKIRQFEDNYWSYNGDLSLPNVHEFVFGMGALYNTCYCPEARSGRVVYSNKQNLDSPIDYWRNFKVNNYLLIPADSGTISKIFVLGRSVYIHTTDMLIDLRSGTRTLSMDRGEVLLGSGDLFGDPVPIYGGVVEGYAGLKDGNSAVVSRYGYIFPDREARRLYLFDGSVVKSLTGEGFDVFMRENMGFSLLDAYPDFEYADRRFSNGIGYSIGFEHGFDRILFTKVDYKPREGAGALKYIGKGRFRDGDKTVLVANKDYFCDNSFTVSYHIPTGLWVSRHNYVPPVYAWDRLRMYSFADGGFWRHNVEGSYQVFYNKRYPFVVELVVSDPPYRFAFDYEGSLLDTRALLWDGFSDMPRPVRITFDRLIAYNGRQSTGVMDIVTDDVGADILERSIDRDGELRLRYDHNLWQFNGLEDRVVFKDEPLFLNRGGNAPLEVNTFSLSKTATSNMFTDSYLVYRFEFDSREDVKLFFNALYTKVNAVQLSI